MPTHEQSSTGSPELPSPVPGRTRPRVRRSTLTAVVIGVLVVAIVVCGAFGVVALRDGHDSGSARTAAGASPTAPPSMPSTDASLKRFYDQRLTWSDCGKRDQCATMKVPLDYAHPGGRTIELKMLKVPASGEKLGSLVVNPGGPGVSAIQYARSGATAWPSTVLRHFDLVGVDPRGVGKSTPLRCASTAQTDRLVAADPDPDTAAERTVMDRMTRSFGEGCLRTSGDLVRHMSTVEVAKDMDVLRQLLGESKLTYFGASYGTLIGATYANLFPTHVGRMVLDGAEDPALSSGQVALAQGHGFEVALRAYVRDCVAQGDCILGDSVDAGTQRIRDFLHQVEKRPLPTSSGRELAIGNAVAGVWLPLYVRSYWPLLTNALDHAMNRGSGSALLALSDAYVSRGPDGYTDNSLPALYAVNCLDDDTSIPTSQVPSHYPQFLRASPTFGTVFAYNLSSCSAWPVHSGRTTAVMHAKGAPPIVVVGTTRDPATPLAWAQGLARELDSGVLITRDGDGHTGYHQGNACVDDAVDDYLIGDVVPKDGLTC